MENVIKTQTPLKKKDYHDKEHEIMLERWGCKPEHTSKLTIRKDENGTAFADRMYHILLHLRYWKETNQHMEHVEEFESKFNINLDELTLPKPSDAGSSAY